MEHVKFSKIFYKNIEDPEKVLLENSWIKKNDYIFYKDRNNYIIEVNIESHPLIKVEVIPKNESFSENDWKLKQDFKRLNNLGKKTEKNLYINNENKKIIKSMVYALIANNLILIYNDEYVVFRKKTE